MAENFYPLLTSAPAGRTWSPLHSTRFVTGTIDGGIWTRAVQSGHFTERKIQNENIFTVLRSSVALLITAFHKSHPQQFYV